MKRSIKQIILNYSIPVLLLTIITIIFRLTNLDITLQKIFYSSTDGWFVKQITPWKQFYRILFHYGNIPAILIILGFILILLAGYWSDKYSPYRKIAVLMILTMIIGPGLIINSGFKEHWGRPRPRHIIEFNGKETFLPVLQKGISGKGKSFPCGHASMGFFLMIPFFFLRYKRKKWALFFLLFGLFYGTLIGIARMIQGGHFASDVIWSAGIVYLTGLILHYMLNIDKNILGKYIITENKKYKFLIINIISAISVLIIIALLLATPYYSEKNFTLKKFILLKANINKINILFEKGTIEITPDSTLSAETIVNGFGFPKSRLKHIWQIDKKSKTHTYKTFSTGWFSELKINTEINIPDIKHISYNIKINEGFLTLNIPKKTQDMTVTVQIQKGSLKILPDDSFVIQSNLKNKKFNLNDVSNIKLKIYVKNNIIRIEDD